MVFDEDDAPCRIDWLIDGSLNKGINIAFSTVIS